MLQRILLALLFSTTWVAAAQAMSDARFGATQPAVSAYSPHNVLQSSGSGAGLAKAATDTFYLYGGPGTREGKFEDAQGLPDRQGWVGVDHTEPGGYWQRSTFNSPTGTMALWCGRSAEQEPGWVAAPGYGNNWNVAANFRAPVFDPGQPTTVNWSFVYNYDSEWGYDYCHADVDSAGTWTSLLSVWGDNQDSTGAFVPQAADITFTLDPSAYVDDAIHLRFRVTTDGGWSDQDGLWPTDGAMQIDDVRVDLGTNGATYFEDFETGLGNWEPRALDFVGDFSKVFVLAADLDPCADNTTPQMGFIDDGTPPNNAFGGESTGGSRSQTYGYGSPEGWVVNYTGGLLGEPNVLYNSVLSPEIPYDLPGPEDDAADGALIVAFDRWTHLPLANGIFYLWSVRTLDDQGWGSFVSTRFPYYGGGVPLYGRTERNVATQVRNWDTLEKVQIELGVVDLSEFFGFLGVDATPSPTFDNVSLRKTRPRGPLLSARAIDLFQDAFVPVDADPASYAGGTPADAMLAVRIDAALAINGAATTALAGDSLVVDAYPVIPGTALTAPPVLHYRLYANPAFPEPSLGGPRDVSMHGGPVGTWTDRDGVDWTIYQGSVAGDSVRTLGGSVVESRFALDLPFDGAPRNPLLLPEVAEPAGFFPGDWLHYYVEVADDAGNVSTLPTSLAGFDAVDPTASGYDRSFRIRGLPTIRDADGATSGVQAASPGVLLVNDAFGFGNQPAWDLAWDQNGWVEGFDYDSFGVMGPSSGVDNGIGSAGVHGAAAHHLAGYSCLLVDTGGLGSLLLNDGRGNTILTDRSDDLGVLTAWHAQEGDRFAAFFGDALVSASIDMSDAGQDFVADILGVELGEGEDDVRSLLQQQTAPRVVPAAGGAAFSASVVAYGGCPGLNRFDHLLPRSGAPSVVAHEFAKPASGGATSVAASVWHERLEDVNGSAYRRVDLTFPFGFQFVQGPASGPGLPDGRSARAVLLAEILAAFDHAPAPDLPTGTEVPLRTALRGSHPNPFNPRTTITFSLAARGRAALRVYNVRGRRVRTLVDDVFEAGVQSVVFDGLDDRGRALASGVYVLEFLAGGQRQVDKMALVR